MTEGAAYNFADHLPEWRTFYFKIYDQDASKYKEAFSAFATSPTYGVILLVSSTSQLPLPANASTGASASSGDRPIRFLRSSFDSARSVLSDWILYRRVLTAWSRCGE